MGGGRGGVANAQSACVCGGGGGGGKCLVSVCV